MGHASGDYSNHRYSTPRPDQRNNVPAAPGWSFSNTVFCASTKRAMVIGNVMLCARAISNTVFALDLNNMARSSGNTAKQDPMSLAYVL